MKKIIFISLSFATAISGVRSQAAARARRQNQRDGKITLEKPRRS